LAKNILIGVVVVLVLLAGAVVIAPSFIDSNALKSQITTQARATTGRELTIDGNLEVRLFPAPALTANDVSLSNAEGGEAENMVALKAVEVRVALMPLLSGQVQVERIRLVGPVINIEKFADGRTNLEIKPSDTATKAKPTSSVESTPSSPESTTGGGGMDIRLDNFEVIEGSVVYRDMATGVVERVDNLDATLRAGSLNGPFEAQGQARVRGVPLAFEVSLGQIIEQRTVPVNAVLNAPGGAHAQITGAVLGLEADPRFKGKIKIKGQSLALLLDAVAGAGAGAGAGVAPTLLGQTYTMESQIDASAASVGLKEFEFQLGQSRATGAIDVALKDGVQFDVQLKASRIDVDAMLDAIGKGAPSTARGDGAASAVASIAPAPPKTQAGAKASAKGFAFPPGVTGTVQLTVDALTVKGGLVSDVRLAAELADGELALSQMQAMAPGVTDVAVFGFVRPSEGEPRFEGNVEVTSSDPTGLTNWLGVQLPAGVAGRVKRVTYKSKVLADAKQVVVSGLEITADKSKLSGGVTLALRKRLSFGADLALDAINLDTYMNGTAKPQSAATASTQDKTAQGKLPSTGTSDSVDIAQAWAALAALNDFDANLKVRIGTLTQQGKTLKNLLLDGTLYAGEFKLRSLKLGDFQGASANLSGVFNGFGAIPEMSKVKIDAKVKNAAKLAANLGATGVPAGLKTVTLKGAAEGSLLKPRFSVNVAALKGQFTGQGSFSLLPIGFGYDGTITAKHGDVVALLKALDLGYQPAGPLGALDLSANLDTNGKFHKITALKSTLGETSINGKITARTDRKKPRVTADLQTGALVLDRFLPKAQKNAALGNPNSRWGKRPVVGNVIYAAFGDDQIAQADKRWSREQFDLSALNLLDGDLTLKADAIQFGTYKLSAADIHATVKDGVLNADKVRGNLFGGPVSGSAIVRATGAPTIESSIKLDTLRVSQAVKAVAGKDLASGNLGLNLDFSATGLSPAELVSSLAGAGDLNINALDVKKGGKGTALSGVIGLVAAMNQLSLSTKKGKGLADLALAFDMRNGIATAKKMTLSSAMGNGSGSGTVDIARWGIDFAGNMTVEPNLLTSLLSKGRIGRQEVPFSVRGALDNPGVNLGVKKASTGGTGGAQQQLDPVQNLLQKALPGIKLPQQKTQPAPTPRPANPQQSDGTLLPPPPSSGSAAPTPTAKPGKPSAEDIIKQLMKGL